MLRDELDRELRRLGVVVEDVDAVTDHEVAVAGGEIRVRVFAPPGAGPHPGFFHFHGGGFVFGTIDSCINDAKCAHICRAAECLVVTVEYRLAPEFQFPTAPEDCFASLLWRWRTRTARLDPARVAVGGESAGGNLAAVVALMARDRGGPPLALQLLEVPVTDISERSEHPSVALFGEGYGLDRAAMDMFTALICHLGGGSQPYASPLVASDLTGVAPAHVLDRGVRHPPRQRRGVRRATRGGRRRDDPSSLLRPHARIERVLADVGTGSCLDGRGRRCDSGCSLRARHRHMIEVVGEALIDDQT